MAKYFKESELKCKCGKCVMPEFDSHLLEVMDNIRGFIGYPLIVNSGYRCPAYNMKVNGKPNSAHTRAKAVDLKADSSTLRYQITCFAMMLGIKRIGIGKDFVHIDVDESLPQEVLWLY